MKKQRVIRVFKTFESFNGRFRQLLKAELSNAVVMSISPSMIELNNVHMGSLNAAKREYVKIGSKFDDDSILAEFSSFADSLCSNNDDTGLNHLFCYQCDKPCFWLAPDARCYSCTRLTHDEVLGSIEKKTLIKLIKIPSNETYTRTMKHHLLDVLCLSQQAVAR